jgi:hypothetical protein
MEILIFLHEPLILTLFAPVRSLDIPRELVARDLVINEGPPEITSLSAPSTGLLSDHINAIDGPGAGERVRWDKNR